MSNNQKDITLKCIFCTNSNFCNEEDLVKIKICKDYKYNQFNHSENNDRIVRFVEESNSLEKEFRSSMGDKI